jgi:hypothetical protein
MPNILGTLANSAGAVLSGTLSVKLLYNVTDVTTTPDSIYLPEAVDFTITNGVVNITLPETETYDTPYEFIFKLNANSDPLLKFYAVVPNVGTLQFASLIPTGISNANLDTGALRVAKLITSDADLVTNIRPSNLFTTSLEAVASTTKYHLLKSFSEGVLIKNLHILITDNPANWTFQVGVVNSTGVDIPLTPTSTPLNTTLNSRLFRRQAYEASQPGTILGLYIQATAGVGSNPLTGSLTLEYTQTV